MKTLTVTQCSKQDILDLVRVEVKKLIRTEIVTEVAKVMSQHQPSATIKNEGNAKMAYSVAAVAELLGLSQIFLRNEIRAGKLKIKRFGSRTLILSEDFENYVNRA